MVLITHHMNEAETADRVIVMDEGEIVLSGTPAEVFPQVDKLRSLGLTTLDTVDVLYRLRQQGWDVPLEALSVEAAADAIVGAMK